VSGPENVWAVYSRLIGGMMKCEFCNGQGSTYQPQFNTASGIYPCSECNGTGLADCCNGMQACQVVDNDWPDNPAEADSFGKRK